jgi:uncharacterized protein (DUF58 family)
MMRHILYLCFRLAYTIKQWVKRRFTPAGLLVLCGLIASAVVGLDTKQTMAYQAFTFLLFLLVISVAWSRLFKTRVVANRKLPQFATVKEPLSYRIVLENKTRKSLDGLSVFEKLEDPRPTFKEFLDTQGSDNKPRNPFDRMVGYHRWHRLISKKEAAKVEEQPLPLFRPRSDQEITVSIVPLRRGHLRLTGFTIARVDPLCLFKSFVTVPKYQSVTVLPRRYSFPPLNLPGTRRYQPGGVALSSSVGDSEEFMSMRDYRPGDPLRQIHWKSWAKTGKPIVKEYQDEFFVRHALILDTFQKTKYSDILEEAVSVAASVAYTIQTQESLLDLMFIGTEAFCFTSGRGLANTGKMLEILASVKACSDKPFSSFFPLITERASLLSGCVCVLLKWDEERKRFIALLKSLGVPVLVLIITDEKSSQQVDPGPMKDNPENLHMLRIGKIQEGLDQL